MSIHLLGEEYVATKNAKFPSYEAWLEDNPSAQPSRKHPKQFLRASQKREMRRQYEFYLLNRFSHFFWPAEEARAAVRAENQRRYRAYFGS